MNGKSTVRHYSWFVAGVWTLAMGCSLAWDVIAVKSDTLAKANIEVRLIGDKDVSFRNWNASLRKLEAEHITRSSLTYVLLWGIGIGGIVFFRGRQLKSEVKRQQDKETLQGQNLFLQTLIDTIPNPVSYKDKNGFYLGCNRAFEEFIGLRREKIIGKTLYDISPKEVADKHSERELALLKYHDIVQRYESPVRHADGTDHAAIFNKAVFLSADGTVGGYIGVINDITDRVKAEEALKKSEERYRTFLELSSDGIWRLELETPIPVEASEDEQIARLYRDAYIVECNAAMAKTHGCRSPEEMVGMRFDALFPELPKQKLGYFIRSGYRIEGRESRLSDKMGNMMHFQDSLVGILDGGFLIRIWGVQHDITELKEMEKHLETIAITDSLTGLYNRRGFMTLSEQQLKTAQRSGTAMLLSFLDLDDLKHVNDAYGHEEGNVALIGAAKILKNTFRESDIIARIGGDEFVVFPVGTSTDCVDKILGRLQKALETYNAGNNRGYLLSISAGISFYDPERPCTIDDLLAAADRSMYERKINKTLPGA